MSSKPQKAACVAKSILMEHAETRRVTWEPVELVDPGMQASCENMEIYHETNKKKNTC